MSLKKPIKVTVSQFKEAVALYLKGDPHYAIRLDGEPGRGKSEIIRQIAEENGLHYVETRLAFKDNPELAGHLVPDKEKNEARYLRPTDLPKEEGTLWFLDEVNRVYHPSVLQTLFQMISTKTVGTHKLPKRTYIFLAGNLGDADDTNVTEFEDRALETRYAWFQLDPTFKEWEGYAKKAGVSQLITSFLEKNTEYWSKLSGRVWFQIDETLKLEKEYVAKLKSGSIPHRRMLEALAVPEAVNEFLHFIKEFNEIDENQILNHFDEVKNQLKEMDRERLFQLNQKLILYFEGVSKNEKIDLANPQEVTNVIKYSFILDKDTATSFISKVLMIEKVILQWKKMREEKTLPFNEKEQKRLRELFV